MSDIPPLVLVPGLLCTAALWAPQVAALKDLTDIMVADQSAANTVLRTKKNHVFNHQNLEN